MTELEFKSLAAQGYNRIPMIAEAFADLETPLTLYLKLAQATNGGKNSFLLESVKGGERFGRYSFIGLPASTVLLLTEELAVIDNVSGKLYLIVYADPTQAEAWSKARQRLKDLRAMLRRSVDVPVTSASVRTEAIRDFAKEDYLNAVLKAKEYIMAGDLMQRDEELAVELLADPKEIAEHVMLIDLARNDIGRIAQTGSVKLTEKMVIEKYSHVQHIVSNVEGLLQPNMSNLDVLKATFPAGTLSGAPKVRAMELIDELEPVKRGIYGGACGYLSFGGEMDLAIAIRTGVLKDGMLYVQAAAGVVADS
eukprot:gene13962-13750_t